MALKAAFIFLAPNVDPAEHRSIVVTSDVEVTTIAACDYAEAEKVAQTLVAEGVQAIELCGGFGNAGTARIVKAVAGEAAVGAVRFDGHPGLGGKSGDEIFGG